MDDEALLHHIWYGAGDGAFGGIERLHAAAKRQRPDITRDAVHHFLRQQTPYQLYFRSQAKKVSPERSFRVNHPGQLVSFEPLSACPGAPYH